MKKIFFLVVLMISPSVFAANVQEIKTKSGFTAWLIEEHSQPIVSVKIAFREAGIAHDSKEKNGRIDVATALLMEGAGDLDAKKISSALDNKAIRMGVNADYDNFYVEIQSLSEHKQAAFEYLGLILAKPRFDADAIERVKKQQIAAINDAKEKPQYKLSRAWQMMLFGEHPYSMPDFGTVTNVEKLEKSDFIDFTNKYLTKENIVISAVGDISPAELSEEIDKNLASLPAKYSPGFVVKDIELPAKNNENIINGDIPQTMVRFGLIGLKRDDPEYITGYVMNYMLGGSAFSSRFGKELRVNNGLVYAVSSSLSPMKHAGIWQGQFSTRNEKAGEAVELLKKTMQGFVEKGVSDQELSDAKKFLTGSFIVGLDSNDNIVDFLTVMQLQNLGIDYMDKRNKLVGEITREQINNLAKRLIDENKLQIVMVGKPNIKK